MGQQHSTVWVVITIVGTVDTIVVGPEIVAIVAGPEIVAIVATIVSSSGTLKIEPTGPHGLTASWSNPAP